MVDSFSVIIQNFEFIRIRSLGFKTLHHYFFVTL